MTIPGDTPAVSRDKTDLRVRIGKRLNAIRRSTPSPSVRPQTEIERLADSFFREAFSDGISGLPSDPMGDDTAAVRSALLEYVHARLLTPEECKALMWWAEDNTPFTAEEESAARKLRLRSNDAR